MFLEILSSHLVLFTKPPIALRSPTVMWRKFQERVFCPTSSIRLFCCCPKMCKTGETPIALLSPMTMCREFQEFFPLTFMHKNPFTSLLRSKFISIASLPSLFDRQSSRGGSFRRSVSSHFFAKIHSLLNSDQQRYTSFIDDVLMP